MDCFKGSKAKGQHVASALGFKDVGVGNGQASYFTLVLGVRPHHDDWGKAIQDSLPEITKAMRKLCAQPGGWTSEANARRKLSEMRSNNGAATGFFLRP